MQIKNQTKVFMKKIITFSSNGKFSLRCISPKRGNPLQL